MENEQLTTEEQGGRFSGFSPLTQQLVVWGIIAAGVLALLLLIFAVRRNWSYHRLEVVSENVQEDTLSVSYCNVDGNILRYGPEGATLRDRKDRTLWTVNYRMQSPQVALRGETIAIYDTSGTEIVVCDREGQIGQISTDLPIRRADVSRKGNVAVLQDEGNSSWIQYYGNTGGQIATVKTAIDDPGYPMDLALSDDGETMMVSYLSYKSSIQKSLLHMYSFSSSGQSQRDNRIAEFEYTDQIIPEVTWIGEDSFVAFRESGFTVYSSGRVPEMRTEVQVDGEIQSVFCDTGHIGMVLRDAGEGELRLRIYDRNGSLRTEKKLEHDFRHVELVNGEVSLYQGTSVVIYSINGVKKFDGGYDGNARSIHALGRQRYLAVTENGTKILKLR